MVDVIILLETCGQQPNAAGIAFPLRVLATLCRQLVSKPVYEFFHQPRATAQFTECFESAVGELVSAFSKKPSDAEKTAAKPGDLTAETIKKYHCQDG